MESLQSTIVDTIENLESFLDAVPPSPHTKPQLFLDLEGANLSRDGSIAILQVHILEASSTYLLDVVTLGKDLFMIKGSTSKRSLKDILESEIAAKVFFDCRNDADALFSHFGVYLRGVHDIQLMEVGSRSYNYMYLNGLAKCVERDLILSFADASRWAATKQRGKQLFAPEHGGSYEVFSKRPIPPEIAAYCVSDADILPRLWTHYKARLSPATMQSTLNEAAWRVERSRDPAYQPHGRQRTLSHWPWTSKEPPTPFATPSPATTTVAASASTGTVVAASKQSRDSGTISFEQSLSRIHIKDASPGDFYELEEPPDFDDPYEDVEPPDFDHDE